MSFRDSSVRREVVHRRRVADRRADEPLDDPLAAELRASRAMVARQRAVRVARRRGAECLERERREELSAAQPRVDPLAGEGIEEVRRVADERCARRPRASRVRRERSRHLHGRREPRARALAPRAVGARGASRGSSPRGPRSRRAHRRRNDHRRVDQAAVHRRESRRSRRRARRAARPTPACRRTPRGARRARAGAASGPNARARVGARRASAVRPRRRRASRRWSSSCRRPRARERRAPARVASRTRSTTRHPSRTSAPASRARSRRIGSSAVRRSASPRSRKARKPCCATKSPRSVAPFGARITIPVRCAAPARSTASSAPMSLRMRAACGLRYSAHGFARGKTARSSTQHARAGARQRVGRRRAGGSAADHDDVCVPCCAIIRGAECTRSAATAAPATVAIRLTRSLSTSGEPARVAGRGATAVHRPLRARLACVAPPPVLQGGPDDRIGDRAGESAHDHGDDGRVDRQRAPTRRDEGCPGDHRQHSEQVHAARRPRRHGAQRQDGARRVASPGCRSRWPTCRPPRRRVRRAPRR